MEKVKILIDGMAQEVYGLFYIYDSKYYFIYTEKEIDEKDYVILYMTQVGKETINTENGPVDTGYMVGVDITNPEEQKNVQISISYIVEDKKNNTVNPQIQYLPINMLNNLKIASKKRFRLLKSIMIENFKLDITEYDNLLDIPSDTIEPLAEIPVTPVIEPIQSTEIPVEPQTLEQNISSNNNNDNVIIDYRTKYFEEEEKNKELQEQINILTEKLNEIKKIVE